MKYYSTNNKSKLVTLKQAVKQGLAEDNGLFMPEKMPQLSPQVLLNLPKMSLPAIAYEIAKCFVEDEVPESELKSIIERVVNFDAPLVSLTETIHSLELFHGPTLAFKDFGARFMAELLSYFMQLEKQKLTVLVATSGDTGSAVAHGFLGKANVDVVILYPSGKVSLIQEKQLTTLGENITTLEVSGTFDDCQALVKKAFLDVDLNSAMLLTSANSINIARLIPQSFYYVYAYSRLIEDSKKIVFSVPSGNFGNITAGLFAKYMGVPIHQFIAATNANDIVPNFLVSGKFLARPSQATISNAMDVGNPSNFARLNDMFAGDIENFRREMQGFAYSDEDTRRAIKEVYDIFGYLCDPHGAVAYLGLKDYFRKASDDQQIKGVFLETAHPAKFLDIVEEVVPSGCELPERLKECIGKDKQAIQIPCDFPALKQFLLSRN